MTVPLGCQGVIVKVTAHNSQQVALNFLKNLQNFKLYEKLGFKNLNKIEYANWKRNGEKVFKNLPDGAHTHCMLKYTMYEENPFFKAM